MTEKKYLVIFLLLVGFLVIEISDFHLFTVPLYGETLAEPPSNFHEENAGTETNPYLIANLANLRWLSETPDVWGKFVVDPPHYVRYHFLQTADIDATETENWYDGKGFNSIGEENMTGSYHNECGFLGTYDGSNHKISKLSIKTPTFIYGPLRSIGFFGYIKFATIKNVILEDISIIPNLPITPFQSLNVGGLVGKSLNSRVINCSVSGQIEINKPYKGCSIGGLISSITRTSIENSHSSVYINNTTNKDFSISGLIDYLNASSLKNSFFNGSITVIEENMKIYGIARKVTHSSLQFCYVTTKNDTLKIKSFIGSTNVSIISNNFWNTETTGITEVIEFEHDDECIIENNFGVGTLEMKKATTFINNGWDFDTIWDIRPEINHGYPYLRSNKPDISNDFEPDDLIAPLSRSWVYPNPARNSDVTFIMPPFARGGMGGSFRSDKDIDDLEISIYNVRGQLVKRSQNFQTKDGEHSFVWNKKDMNDREVASGVYFYRINSPQLNRWDSTNASTQAGKFLILK